MICISIQEILSLPLVTFTYIHTYIHFYLRKQFWVSLCRCVHERRRFVSYRKTSDKAGSAVKSRAPLQAWGRGSKQFVLIEAIGASIRGFIRGFTAFYTDRFYWYVDYYDKSAYNITLLCSVVGWITSSVARQHVEAICKLHRLTNNAHTVESRTAAAADDDDFFSISTKEYKPGFFP